MIKPPTLSEIRRKLKANGEMLIEYEERIIDSTYFNNLVLKLPKYNVSEIRPLHKICISKGIDTEIIVPHLNTLIFQIRAYIKVREYTFNQFLNHFNLKDIEGNFYKLRTRLKENDTWPKGEYKDWNYWSHGGDIEFDNRSTGEHFNIRMSNIRSVKYWSIYKFIMGTNEKSEIREFLIKKKEVISKMFDLLVIDKKMKVIRTDFGEKQYELEDYNGA